MKVAILLGLLLSAVVVKAGRCLDGNNYCPDVRDYAQNLLVRQWKNLEESIMLIEDSLAQDNEKKRAYGEAFEGQLPQWKATLAQLEDRINEELSELPPKDQKEWAKINGRMAAMEKRRAAFNRQMASMEKRRAVFKRRMASMDK